MRLISINECHVLSLPTVIVFHPHSIFLWIAKINKNVTLKVTMMVDLIGISNGLSEHEESNRIVYFLSSMVSLVCFATTKRYFNVETLSTYGPAMRSLKFVKL